MPSGEQMSTNSIWNLNQIFQELAGLKLIHNIFKTIDSNNVQMLYLDVNFEGMFQGTHLQIFFAFLTLNSN